MPRAAWIGLLALAACFSKPDRPGNGMPPGGGSGPVLVAGRAHACTIVNTDQLFCWGDNHDGQLGTTSVLYSASPVHIPGSWKYVAAGSRHTCAIDSDEAVWCWGASDVGQAGPMASSLPPTKIALPDPMTRARSVYAGGDASCIIDETSYIYCWGNFEPQTQAAHSPEHVLVGENGGADDAWGQVAMSNTHLCALNDDRGVWCWGNDSDLELDDPSATAHTAVDAFHVPESAFFSIAVASDGTCGITTSDTVACWGAYELTGQTATTSTYAVIDTRHNWGAIAAGGGHGCALMNNGDLDCWGLNSHGELGNDYFGKDLPGTLTLAGVTAVAAGDQFTCAADMAGIKCWGSDQYGQTGRGTSATVHSPKRVALPEPAISVAAGLAHTCAAGASGKVYCWGNNQLSQVYDNAAFAVTTPHDTGYTVDLLATDYRLLSLGAEHTCVRASKTKLDCWGDNRAMELSSSGNGVQLDASLGLGAGATQFIDFSAGGFGTCASTDKKELYCWGTLGEPPHDPVLAGNYVTVAVSYNRAIAAIAMGSTNDVVQFGDNNFCDNPTGDIVPDSGSPLQRKVFLAQGGDHGCVLDNDNVSTTTLVCWGDNVAHQISSNAATCIDPPVLWSSLGTTRETLPNGVMWAQNKIRPQTVAVGGDHTCAIEEDTNNVGALYCWGDNSEAELGDLNDPTLDVKTPHPAVSNQWYEVATGQYHTCALTAPTGDVYCWGLNQWGEVGNGDRFPTNAAMATAIQF